MTLLALFNFAQCDPWRSALPEQPSRLGQGRWGVAGGAAAGNPPLGFDAALWLPGGARPPPLLGGRFYPCRRRRSCRVRSESPGRRVHPLSVFPFPFSASPPLLVLCHRAFKNTLSLAVAVLPASAPLGGQIPLCSPWLSLCSFPSGAGMLQRNRQLDLGDAGTPLPCSPHLLDASPSRLCSHTFPFSVFPAVSKSPLAPFLLLARKQVLDITFPNSGHLTFSIFVKNTGRKEG